MKRILVSLALILFAAVVVAQVEPSPVVPAVPRTRSSSVAERPDTPNARRVLDELKAQGFSVERGTSLLAPEDWVGPCFASSLPYQGAFDATSVWWGGTFNQPSSTTCLTTDGWWVDVWDVSVHSGDAFDIVFGGGYNTFIGIDNPGSSTFYDFKYATTWSSSGSDYITGWIGFTVPAAWTNLRLYVERQTGQTGYLLGAIKRSSVVSACTPSSINLCLSSSRFRVSATYSSSSGAGTATAVGMTGDTGYFWFFNSANVEAVVKVIDGRGVNGKFWVFAGGLTNVNVTITVRDTVTGATRNYTNPQNVAFLPVQDTLAFSP